jgi:hypothetical protein
MARRFRKQGSEPFAHGGALPFLTIIYGKKNERARPAGEQYAEQARECVTTATTA